MLNRMVSISWPRHPPALASQSAGITGVSHRARPQKLLLIQGDKDETFHKLRMWSKGRVKMITTKLVEKLFIVSLLLPSLRIMSYEKNCNYGYEACV